MLGFLPIFILLAAAIAVVILQFVPRGKGIAWMVSVIASIGVWILVLVIKSRLPFSFSNQLFLDLGIKSIIPAVQFDIINWPFIASICAVLIGILIVSSARIGIDSTCWEWAGILLLGVVGISGCMAANLLTAIIILGLFDLVDVFIIFIAEEDREVIRDSLKHAIWRFISLILFLTAFAWQNSQASNADDWNTLLSGPAYLILAACMIRLALFPSIKISGIPRKTTNGLLVSRLIIGFLISTTIIVRLPFHAESSIWKNILLVYLLFEAFISVFWIIRNNEDEQSIAWQAFAGSLICAEYLYGFSAAGLFFTISIVTLFQLLIIEYPTSNFSKGIALLSLIGFSGLPFTPNNTGLAAFTWKGQIPGFLFLFPAIIVFFSFIRNILRKRSNSSFAEERWAAFLAPTGLLFPVITPWIISISWLPAKFEFNLSIQALIMTLAGSGLFLAEFWHLINLDEFFRKLSSGFGKLSDRRSIFTTNSNLDFEQIIQQPGTFITELFEGDGGILWAVLCLVLVITIMQSLGIS